MLAILMRRLSRKFYAWIWLYWQFNEKSLSRTLSPFLFPFLRLSSSLSPYFFLHLSISQFLPSYFSRRCQSRIPFHSTTALFTPHTHHINCYTTNNPNIRPQIEQNQFYRAINMCMESQNSRKHKFGAFGFGLLRKMLIYIHKFWNISISKQFRCSPSILCTHEMFWYPIKWFEKFGSNGK